jgi:hypothetical protein
MPTDNHDKQKLITRTKTDPGRGIQPQVDTAGSHGDRGNFG